MNDMIAIFLGDFSIYWHGVVIAGAILLAVLTTFLTMRSQDKSARYDVLLTAAIALPLAFICSRAFYCFFMKSDLEKGTFALFDFSSGGYALFGALAGVFLAAFIVAKMQRVSFYSLADALSPALCLAIAIGRMSASFSAEERG
ncbi:MAG: prolipoprotein diacylglyceryl transferase, partial [Clostridia bacterium]|nr:prolipoprotein diacylglyceryl transferase [Clostridia bacterium]